jgi:hypothetical protein
MPSGIAGNRIYPAHGVYSFCSYSLDFSDEQQSWGLTGVQVSNNQQRGMGWLRSGAGWRGDDVRQGINARMWMKFVNFVARKIKCSSDECSKRNHTL